jgi:23S rRNA (adenine-N6)-dimethyltransferase
MPMVTRSRRMPPSPSGTHFLSCPSVAVELVRSSGVGVGDLVVDVGAGAGAITAPLAATGARVLAVERDPRLARRLERRFADRPTVRVVHGDLRAVPLPRRAYSVVASIPFATSTALVRRLLQAPDTALARADLVVEWGLARRLTDPHPRSLEAAWWAARFDLRLRRRIPASCFAPAPSADAAHLAIRRTPGLDHQAQRVLWALLRAAYAQPRQPARAVLGAFVPRRRAHQLLTSSGIDPPAPAGAVPARRWAGLAATLAAERTPGWPPLAIGGRVGRG